MKKYLFLSAGVILLFVSVLVFRFLGIEDLAYSLNYLLPSVQRPDSVAIVGIDIRSIEKYGAWPWNRSTMAALIRGIESAGPRAIAPDFLFLSRPDDPQSDTLASAFAEVDNLVLPFRFASFASDADQTPYGIPVPLHKYRFARVQDTEALQSALLFRGAEFVLADTLFVQQAAYGGFVNVSTTRTSQKVTEAIHLMRGGTEYFPSFGLAAAAAFLGVAHSDAVLSKGPTISLRDRTIPLSSFAATSFVNYRGPAGTVPTVSAGDVLDGSADYDLLKGKLVFLGVTEPGIVQDFFTTPVGPDYPGVEIWATAAADIIERTWVRYGGGGFGLLNWLLALSIFPGLTFIPYRKKFWSVMIASGVALGSLVIGFVLFRYAHYFWNPLSHASAWALSLVWLSLQKSDPVLAGTSSLDFEPRQSPPNASLAPATENDYLKEVPSLDSAKYVASKLPDSPLPSTSTPLPGLEVSDATMVEATLPAKPVSSGPSDNKIAGFRKLCNGEIITALGSGGMADVYLIWNPRMEVYRAVKVLKPGQPDRFLTRFETEIRIAASLSHPNIVQCFSVGDWFGLPYIEMEYVNGVSFEEFLTAHRSLSPAETAAVGILVCRALSYAHQEVVSIYGTTYSGIVHRDLKPANIMISRSGHIKLTDFGIARPTQVSLHTVDTGTIVGTLPYLAPEQADGGDITARSDIYALGVTLFEFLTGERAFPQTEMTSLLSAKVAGTIKPLTPGPLAPRLLVEAINTAISPDPAGRFSDAHTMGKSLEKALSEITDKPGYEIIAGITHRFWKG